MRRPHRHLLCATLRRGLSFALVVLLIFSPGLGAGWDFNAISTQTERLYGPATPAARQRIDEWAALLKNPPQGTIQDKLNQVNRFFNARMAFKDDIVVWHQQDYWATPIEFLRKGAGDCEDFALAKYFTLREMGVPANQLRITYVKALQLNQAHMVVTWYATPDAIPLVLDNLKTAILPATQRTDLLPVYAFNGEGLWLPQSGGNKRVGDSKRLSRWQDLLTRMRAEGFEINE
ncbi:MULTISPECIES: cysteine protease LapG [Enterobacteriaceae]|jgi:predicted transglutaminase-like cysteine proteinase|uniref:cysteine protease LapG n=1 Tax=Enterobacteriaceae TaxID=543 RepID=UPI0018812503|nr:MULTISPECIES: transglutaminase-like cysteine peptidase [Enterobacteriaceae]MDU7197614.1 transglutaminase-like cysteine peptidase [Enterobacteriaceae bacterium]MBV8872938.1 transglutaminase-like cysteine peptidase [Phytobacter sp.]MBY6257226.1 transglutaminase-like cysteine peptidase [Phytobacter diazotrophicus]MDV2871666.1 transglutaminase-like cysteine peptidase [Phytobacter diazotrophicus]QOV67586.1 transglutaminase-like cysteine peptidase [Citrobacter sp. BDA59-3]